MSKIFCTGVAGFIGSHLAEALIAEGHIVWGVDNLSTGRIENLDAIRKHKNFTFTRGDILNDNLMREFIRGCDIVFHLAAAVGTMYFMDNPLKSIDTNIKGTENIVSLVAEYDKKLFFASTSGVYGKAVDVPMSEDGDRLFGATSKRGWLYGETKCLDEFLIWAYKEKKNLKAVIMRFFNTVGPRQVGNYGMVVPRFIKAAMNDENINVYGDGSQTRSFAHVTDTVNGMLALMGCPEAIGEVFNIGNEHEISILDLACKIRELADSHSTIERTSYEKAYGGGYEEIPRRVPDISKIKKFTKWEPKISLDDIIKSMIVYEKNITKPT